MHPWATNYVGHFLVEAKNMGFDVPSGLIRQWVYYQKKESGKNLVNSKTRLTQAYRLYTLALAGFPDVGAMNRLKFMTSNAPKAVSDLLAAAYSLSSLEEAAKEVFASKGSAEHDKYKGEGATLGSPLRDRAMTLLASIQVGGDKNRNLNLVETIAKNLSSDDYHSTHAIGFSLLALAKYQDKHGSSEESKFETMVDGTSSSYAAKEPIWQKTFLDEINGKTFEVINKSEVPLYVTVSSSGIPKMINSKGVSSGIGLEVKYMDSEGNEIEILDAKKGDDIYIKAIVRNPGFNRLTNLALVVSWRAAG